MDRPTGLETPHINNDAHHFETPASKYDDYEERETEKTTIYDLPPEILDLFLENVSPSELQRTALSIQQVFPGLAVSESHIFRHLRVTGPSQLKPLWKRLREDKSEGEGRLIRAVRTFTMLQCRVSIEECCQGISLMIAFNLEVIPTCSRYPHRRGRLPW
jgi:hypothetical protein